MKKYKRIPMIAFAAVVLAVSGCANENSQKEEQKAPKEEKAQKKESNEEESNAGFIIKAKQQKLEHIHGIGFPGNDQALYVASHEGLKIYKDGAWFETSSDNHDYMGFQVVKDGFYSSGHPEKGSGLKNPLGLVKSTDSGKNLDKIAFYGESDFHFMAASFQDETLYVINEQPNSKLDTGVYVSKDKGGSWEEAGLNGFDSNTYGMIAVHPDQGETFAMSTKDGVFVSSDYGKTIKEIGEYEMVTAAAFSKDSLYISPIENKKLKLVKLNPDGTAATELAIPNLAVDNPITYIAADYKMEGKLAIMTYQNDLYETTDGGKTWNQVLVKGNIQ